VKTIDKVVICDTITHCVLFICVTVAAIHFENWKIMFLCLLGALFSSSYHEKQTPENNLDEK